MFKDFDIKPFKKKKPPVDSGYTTRTEINELKKIPLKKAFVKKNDDIEAAFKKTAKDNNIEDYDKNIAAKLPNYEMASMKTKSYPSGHSVQGILIAKVLGDKYPKAKSAFAKTGENISYSRRVARAHYKSDSKMGEKLGNKMYNYIKKDI